VSWWLTAVPLSVTDVAMLDWVRNEFPDAYGLPTELPARRPLPTVTHLVDAIEQSGCHGSAWFSVEGQDGSPIPSCANRRFCARTDGWDLGEVNPQVNDGTGNGDVVQWTSAVESIGFRNPSPTAVLRTTLYLAKHAGSFLLLDDMIDHAFVLDPADDRVRLAAAWPWSD
jgi:hypothetical protein